MARVFVLPNLSGRNAHFSYTELLAVFRRLPRDPNQARSNQARSINVGLK